MSKWEMVKLKEVTSVITCGVAKRPEYVENGVMFLSSKNVKKNKISLKFFNCISENDYFTLTKNNKPKKGDILYTRVGSFGEAAIVDFDINFAIFVSLTLIKPLHNKIYNRYLVHYLNSPKVMQYAKNNTTGIGVQNLNVAVVRGYEVPLPPLNVQKHIADTLDKAQEIIDGHKKQLEELVNLIKATFYDMFGDPVKNEKGWEVYKLVDVSKKITDGKHGDCKNEDQSGYYFISAKDIVNDKIVYDNARQITCEDFLETDKRTNLTVGDVIVVNTGATIGKVTIAEMNDKVRCTTFQKSVGIIQVDYTMLSNIYLKQYIIIDRVNIYNSASGSAQKNWLLSQMRNYRIMLPPLKYQNKFAEKAEKIEEQKSIVKQSIAESEMLFNSLMSKYFD